MTDKNLDICGCGKPARYMSMNDPAKGSCNKRRRCLTYDEMKLALHQAERRVLLYSAAVNKIDDYFEYQMESRKDQKKVHQILGNLTDDLAAT